MSSESSAAKDHKEPIHPTSSAESVAAVAETLDVEQKSHDAAAGDINAADEVKGTKLALIVVGLCFSNILTGLVSRGAYSQMELLR